MKKQLLVPALCGILLFSCKKDKTDSGDRSVQTNTAAQTSLAENFLNDGVNTAIDLNDGTEDNSGVFRNSQAGRVYACATVTHNLANRTVTIDFGTSPCTGADGHARSGKIIITYTGPRDSSTARTIQFQNYKRDSVNMNGTLTMGNITRTGQVSSFTLETTGGNFVFTFDAGGTFVVTAFSRTYTINRGLLPFDLSDNTTSITGSVFTGINRQGQNFSVEIVNAILFKGICTLSGIYYPAEGTHRITVNNLPSYTIDWGTGTCDKVVTLTILGQTYTLTLP